jgi:hypothetical protein
MSSGAGLIGQLVADVPSGLTLTPTPTRAKSLLGREAVHFQEPIKKKLRGFGPQANYTDRATAACRRNWHQL